jgi:hypothetical protein
MCRRDLLGIMAWCCVVGAMETVTLAATPPDEMQSDVDSGVIKLDRTPTQATKERVLSGNPLWAIPLGSLAITRERPIFSPSRRPLAPAVMAPTNVTQPRTVVSPAQPQRPNLTLVGTVVGTTEGFGVFLDQTTHNIVRLKTGEGHAGWILRSVKTREATLEKERQTETLRLPAPGENSPGAQK